ncbi:Multi antimicrobial extrusion protein [Corchorus capsularis]|uniref:Protein DETOXIFICATION n=1 Tax=Corchorus capsularis TaxID=210143 RepID=A0A1R3ICG8_COCAP|nr:Multi antimicrobial extrusion protein [Corchorus capsularis]
MEEALLLSGGGDGENKWKIKWSAFGEELKKMSYMAVPMVAVTVSQYLSQVISVMIVGHIDELALSGIALASSFTNVTGFSLIVIGLASWFNVALLAFYMRYSSSCEKSRAFIFNDVFLSVKEYFSFGLPSAVMVCLTTGSLHFFVPYGISAAASTRVSNELGAGNPQAARFAVGVAMVLAAIEPLIVSITLFCCRYIYGYLFSNEAEVVNYVAEMLPLLCISIIMDSIQAVLSGVARGTGWQHIGAYVNLGAYYLVGIPLAAVLCFALNMRGKGLWMGIMAGTFVQALLLALVTGFTNWQKQENEKEIKNNGRGIAARWRRRGKRMEDIDRVECVRGGAKEDELHGGADGGGDGVAVPYAGHIGDDGWTPCLEWWSFELLVLLSGLLPDSMLETSVLSICNEAEVVNYVAEILPLICISVIMDSFQTVMSGVARGTGWQHIGAYVNLGAYYLVGIPVAAVLCFVVNLRGKGLWIGILSGTCVQVSLLGLVTGFTNWQKQASKARERIFDRAIVANKEIA